MATLSWLLKYIWWAHVVSYEALYLWYLLFSRIGTITQKKSVFVWEFLNNSVGNIPDETDGDSQYLICANLGDVKQWHTSSASFLEKNFYSLSLFRDVFASSENRFNFIHGLPFSIADNWLRWPSGRDRTLKHSTFHHPTGLPGKFRINRRGQLAKIKETNQTSSI